MCPAYRSFLYPPLFLAGGVRNGQYQNKSLHPPPDKENIRLLKIMEIDKEYRKAALLFQIKHQSEPLQLSKECIGNVCMTYAGSMGNIGVSTKYLS